ncbi:hypothetical protein Calkr_2587 [Caldicellulosiruptor acetigenus I77R1B]|uniref:Uncharacterized protein n=1 Tax=Caldicellulosiruptor acetigenus (strain ATCC 700853 / DSM 12137 / I77R1B) TaxID=632335 RepID=E4S906_CALA7|nr:hypothetical protein [Caldicellulosiruptor acetigenus]ADQ42011.1 hypothetical protein Calkr_2587 [Caldicellulosiruptor acetigenus I77R1B]
MNYDTILSDDLFEKLYKEPLIKHVGEHLRTFMSLRELLKDEPGNFKRPKEYMYFKQCPGWLGICPYGKKERNEKCDPTKCWNIKYGDVKDKIPDFKNWNYDKILIKVLSPAICPDCGSKELKIVWGKRINVKVAGHTVTFDDVAYLKCQECGKINMSNQDKKAIEVIKERIREYDPYAYVIEDPDEELIELGYNPEDDVREFPETATIHLTKDKVALDLFMDEVEKYSTSLDGVISPVDYKESEVMTDLFSIRYYGDKEDMDPIASEEDDGEDVFEE